ncbi:MAG: TonB C-terminal domain-containing protein [Desulfobacca sp.]|nr:TonB C-terminal domain-containing protein [Desulfobacca sp.]
MTDLKLNRIDIEPQTPTDRLGMMLVLSLVCHLVLFAAVLFMKPMAPTRLEITPSYTVDLVNLPPAGPSIMSTKPGTPTTDGLSGMEISEAAPKEQKPVEHTEPPARPAPAAPEPQRQMAKKSVPEAPRPAPAKPAPQPPAPVAKKSPVAKPTPAPRPAAVPEPKPEKPAPQAQVKTSPPATPKPALPKALKKTVARPTTTSTPPAKSVKPKPSPAPPAASPAPQAPAKPGAKSATATKTQVREPSPPAEKPAPESTTGAKATKAEGQPSAAKPAAATKAQEKQPGAGASSPMGQAARDQSIQEAVQGVEKGLAAAARDQALREAVSQVAAKLEAGKVRARWVAPGKSGGGGSGPAPGGAQGRATPITQAYMQRAADLIRAQWQPHSLQRSNLKDLKTVIVIRVNANGTIAASWFEQESGDRLYDQSAMTAITRSTPLPALPAGVEQLEIGVTFSPEWKASS